MSISISLPSAVMQSIASDVTGIPTPISIVGGLFGGGKHHPGRYSFRYIWGGIKIDGNNIASVSPVVVEMIYRQRLWRAGEQTSERPVPFKCFTYMIAKRLGDLINDKIPADRRMPLKIAFQQLNPKFRVVTWSAHLEALRQQGPANAAFDALKYAPAVLNTYGNCVRQMLGVKDMHDFLVNYIGWDYLYPLSPIMRQAWREKGGWEDYGEWLLDNLKYRSPAGVRNWMARTGIRTADLISGVPEGSVSYENEVRKLYLKYLGREPDPSGFKYWVNIAKTKGISFVEKALPNTPAATKEIESKVRSFYLKYLGREPDPSGFKFWVDVAKKRGIDYVERSIASSPEAFKRAEELKKAKEASISDFAKKLITPSVAYAAERPAMPSAEEKSILSKISIDDILLFSAIAIPAVFLLTRER